MRLVGDGGGHATTTDERAHFMRCPYCSEFFDMRMLSELTRHYDFSPTRAADGMVTLWPLLGHVAPGLHTDPEEIAWLEDFHGAKGTDTRPPSLPGR